MASLPLSRSSTCSSTDSDESDADSAMLASCSLQLQEIRQEDLAAILPDQQEIDAFGAFEEAEKNSPQTGDASSSDMELPQQAVNAIIERTTESSSENESHPAPNPNTLYANSLLQQFVAQTQMLNTSSAHQPTSGDLNNSSNQKADTQSSGDLNDAIKRKRGRPKKTSKLETSKEKDKTLPEYCGDPNVSPDSGIQNSPDHVSSPDCSPMPISKSKYLESKKLLIEKSTKKHDASKNSTNSSPSKITVTSNRFDRILYGNTDRVLYPPRRKAGRPPINKHKGPGRPPKLKHIDIKMEEITTKSHKSDKFESSGKSNKIKKPKTLRDKDILQLTTNTHGLSLGIKEQKLSKSTHLYEICERVSKRLELNIKSKGKTNKSSRVILGSKNKIDRAKIKYVPLKNSKLMHSKHKHKKHKKCKLKILKPVASATSDPKLNSEIDKLIQDFVKLCSISTSASTSKPAKENVPEILKVLKKVSKKRKTSDYSERKKKKLNTTTINKETNSNEQRLPLKKRHYHLSTNSDNKQDSTEVTSQTDTENEAITKNKTIPKTSLEKIETTQKNPIIIKPATNTLAKIATINNNDYDVQKLVNMQQSHIEEAIEACINKYSSTKEITIKMETFPLKIEKTPTTTPKKRHRLEATNITPEYPIESKEDVKKLDETIKEVITENILEQVKKCGETVAQINTRKKNRLEDLTSCLVSKIVPELPNNKRKKEIKSEDRATVIKYPACKKAKPIELDTIVDEKPTGIFMPTVDLELHMPKEKKLSDKEIIIKEDANLMDKIAKIEIKTEVIVKKKVRKRRAINRTGFPTIKKKKKKILAVEVPIVDIKPVDICDTFDRVPKDGEEYSIFVERTEKLSKAALDKLPQSSDLYNVTKWEVLSECDSLPLEDRIDFDSLDVKQERMSLRNRDSSPATSVDTRISDRIKTKRDCTPDTDECGDLFKRKDKFKKRKRELLERKCNRTEEYLKKRLREVSPASSIEPFAEKIRREDRASASGDDTKKGKKPPRWRKKYLLAGLFSDYYKDDEKRNENAIKTKLIYNPAEHPYGLLPAPYHCGKYLRCRKVPFELPHDLWWQHTHSQLPGRDMVPSWNYRKIRTNVYNVKNTAGACEPQACNCNTADGCGDDCINRLVLSECPASHKCLNQKIQRHEWAPGIEKFMTEFKGWGVRTNLTIKNSDFILEYVGEVVSDQEFKERMATRYVHDTHHYCLHLDGGLVIDGHRMGGDGRFVNHSCEPNCEMQKWSVNGQFRMALFALRDIKETEELTYDYNFSLFNAAEGQECKCGSDNCRGVIGGKSQRVRQNNNNPPHVPTGRVGRPRKNQAKKALNDLKDKENATNTQTATIIQTPLMKPMSHAQRLFVLEHHCFLLRNLKKVKKVRDQSICSVSRTQAPTPTEQSATFLNHLNALRQPRNMKTRRFAQAEDNPELNKTVRLATVLRDIYNKVLEAKDENNDKLSIPFLACPSKRKVPEYFIKVTEPIDLTVIEQNIESGVYKTSGSFDADMIKLFTNVIKFYGRPSDLGIAATRLKKIYNEAKEASLPKFENVLGVKAPAKFTANKKKGEEEDVIRCICGMYTDEGLMIQCERCLVWQHSECVQANADAPSYHCENCVPRDVDYEIQMDEFTEHGHQYHMTLLRGSMQLRQGDTVYVLRDIPIPGSEKKHTYDTIGKVNYADLDIFRIERLWKDSKTGERFAYGHHYLRPHETYHEPSRKFFPNEVMRVPLYEAVPVELVISHCWVMDLNTYCKGRPITAPEEHIYICEYRVDKSARLFSKVAKSKFPTCTKTYAFERFDTRLKISRTYTPHDLEPSLVKQRGRKPQEIEEPKEIVKITAHIPVIRTRSEKKTRLNGILLNLLSKLPTKQGLDVSYLLEGGRRRKKQT